MTEQSVSGVVLIDLRLSHFWLKVVSSYKQQAKFAGQVVAAIKKVKILMLLHSLLASY